MHTLLSLVLELHPVNRTPVSVKSWYGRSAQAVGLFAVRDAYSRRFSTGMHQPNHLRAYTASSLFSDNSLDGYFSTDNRYFLRFTALNEETACAFRKATHPSEKLSVGKTINLAGAKMQVLAAYLSPSQHPLAAMTSYTSLWNQVIKQAGRLPPRIHLSFNSPTFFKSTQTNSMTPFLSPHLVFASLAAHWLACSQLELPGLFLEYARKSIRIIEDDLQLVEVNDGRNPCCGSVGRVTYQADNPRSPYWVFAHILARFAFFSGVGKGTAMGFGQCVMTD